MLTKNFYSCMRVMFQQVNAPFQGTDGATKTGGWWSGSASKYIQLMAAMKNPILQLTAATYGVQFGSGRTKATVDDFALEEPITSGLTFVKPSAVAYNRRETFEEYVVTIGVTASTDVTIGEIGTIGHCVDSGNQSSIFNFLGDRTVLETPIYLKANESAQITYTIRFNYPVS